MRDELSALSAFLAVAEQRSFTRAARGLGVSPSALSHAVRGLEERIGVRLLARTTRSVAPTDAGQQLLARLRPAFGDIRACLSQLSESGARPAGRLRLVVSPMAAALVLAPRVHVFAREYPAVVLDVTISMETRIDLVAGGFDAGIRLGEFIEQDMVAVKVSDDQRAAIVGAPEYFAVHGRPKSPRDLTKHRCLNFRLGSAGIYRWEFDKGRRSLAVAVDGPVIVDDAEIMLRIAMSGSALAYAFEQYAAPHVASGALERVLEDWCPPFPGYFLYYPSRRQQPAALSALIETLRL